MASLVTYSNFLAKYEEFAGQNTTLVQQYLDIAELDCPSDVWGGRQVMGVELLAAHRLAIRLANVGRMIGATDGATYGSSLDATSYGQEFSRIRSSLPITGFTV